MQQRTQQIISSQSVASFPKAGQHFAARYNGSIAGLQRQAHAFLTTWVLGKNKLRISVAVSFQEAAGSTPHAVTLAVGGNHPRHVQMLQHRFGDANVYTMQAKACSSRSPAWENQQHCAPPAAACQRSWRTLRLMPGTAAAAAPAGAAQRCQTLQARSAAAAQPAAVPGSPCSPHPQGTPRSCRACCCRASQRAPARVKFECVKLLRVS